MVHSKCDKTISHMDNVCLRGKTALKRRCRSECLCTVHEWSGLVCGEVMQQRGTSSQLLLLVDTIRAKNSGWGQIVRHATCGECQLYMPRVKP